MTPGRISFAATIAFALLSVRASGETIQVTIDKLVFAPAEVSAKVGDAIEWINKDALVHTATARNGDWNVNIPAGQRGQIELKKAGTVDEYCELDPNISERARVRRTVS